MPEKVMQQSNLNRERRRQQIPPRHQMIKNRHQSQLNYHPHRTHRIEFQPPRNNPSRVPSLPQIDRVLCALCVLCGKWFF
jgi:hypothetical protein